MRMLRLIAVLLGMLAPGLAAAEDMVLSLSSELVVIASNFTGTEVVLFGAVLQGNHAGSRVGPYDIVVTVRGPSRDIIVRRKEQVAWVWINREHRTFTLAPSYLAVLSTRSLDRITSPALQDRYGVGVATALPGARAARQANADGEAFGEALVRHYAAAGLYREIEGGVTLLGNNLFRATIPIPPNVPIGLFEVDVKLFAGSVVVAQEVTTFRVAKSGFEAQMAAVAEHYPWIYGICAGGLALFFGWAATVVFRRD